MERVSSDPAFQEKMAGMSENYRWLDADAVKARLDQDYAMVEELLQEVPDAFN